MPISNVLFFFMIKKKNIFFHVLSNLFKKILFESIPTNKNKLKFFIFKINVSTLGLAYIFSHHKLLCRVIDTVNTL